MVASTCKIYRVCEVKWRRAGAALERCECSVDSVVTNLLLTVCVLILCFVSFPTYLVSLLYLVFWHFLACTIIIY